MPDQLPLDRPGLETYETLGDVLAAEFPDLDPAEAAQLAAAAQPLWQRLDGLAWTDAYDGMECRRVLCETLRFIRIRASVHLDPRAALIDFIDSLEPADA